MTLPLYVRREITKVAGDVRLWAGSDEALRQHNLVDGFVGLKAADDALAAPVSAKAAARLLDWAERVPEALRGHDQAPWMGGAKVSERSARKQLAEGLLALNVQARALLWAGSNDPKAAALNAMHLSFGGDAASTALRKDLLGRKHPGLPQLDEHIPPAIRDYFNDERLREIVLGGSLRELMQSFAACGLAAQQDRDWIAQVQPFGQIEGLKPARACGGHKLRVSFAAFGNVPPDPSVVADIVLAIPTTAGCQHFSLRQLAPALFNGGWSDTGSIVVVLPENVFSGALGFFTLPLPQTQDHGCSGGRLSTAAGMWQSLLGQYFKTAGIVSAQPLVELTQQLEAQQHRALPCAVPQVDGANLLEAGPPQIHQFRSDEVGPVHPRGSLMLRWSVSNATHVEIVAEDIPSSENPHELPPITGPLPLRGSLRIAIPCTRRWEGRYRLIAHNANGCTTQPVQAELNLRSGFSAYRLGVARHDVTDYRRGLPLAGFAYERQVSDGVDMPLYARAFSIQENRNGGNHLTLVVADIWTCTQIVKREVLERLNRSHPARAVPRYTHENLLIAGTHTHSGPGGYSEYFLYNLSIGGFDQGVFDTIVNGIVQAVQSANLSARPGRLFVNAGEVEDCGVNRSLEAFSRNPEFNPLDPGSWIDREMLLLAFWVDEDNRGRRTPLGLLNWYAIHPTALGMFNNKVSGDCKGHAELLTEAHFDAQLGRGGVFVAAFGNGNAGDVSGNIQLDAAGNKRVERPMGGDVPAAPVTILPAVQRHPSKRAQDIKRMQQLGQRQHERARELFDAAKHELTGALRCAHMFVDMSAVDIDARPGERTSTAALGISFGAGSSEDSIAYATMGPLDIDAGILEGMNVAERDASRVLFWANAVLLLGPRLPLFISAIAGGGAPLLPLTVSTLLSAFASMVIMPGARSYGAALVGAAAFDGKVKDCPPQEHAQSGRWEWVPPAAPDAALHAAHGDKPIMFDVGNWKVRPVPNPQPDHSVDDKACPLVPQVLPLQLICIDTVVLAGVPAEFNGMAGRRLKQTLRGVLGSGLSHVAVSNYSGGYSGYVSTREEYGAQHYEGACTLYGPATLEAYQQCFVELARRILGSAARPVSGEQSKGFVAPAIYRRP